MNRHLQRHFFLLTLIICLTVVTSSVSVSAADLVAKGTYQGAFPWTLSTEGTLTIEGNGVVPRPASNTALPWNAHLNSIKTIIIGDSITFGTPYTGTTSSNDPYYCGSSDRYLFSWPRRLNQITGVNYTNVSVAGSTYTNIPGTTSSSHRCLTNSGEVAQALRNNSLIPGRSFDTTIDGLSISSPGTYADYDIVVLSAGTNDARYLKTDLGTISKENMDNGTLTGALNTIMSAIAEGSADRVASGKDPIIVVTVDMFYRSNSGSPSKDTMNKFQNQIDKTVAMWNGDSGIKVYKCTESSSYINASNADQLTSDYLHLTRFAQGQFGAKMADYMIKEGILE